MPEAVCEFIHLTLLPLRKSMFLTPQAHKSV